jgi:hypothetical protein
MASGGCTVSKDSKPARKPAEIEGDIVDTRQRLVGTISEIQDRVSPANVANRSVDKVKAFYVDEDGVRWKNVAVTAGGVVGGIVALRLVSMTVRWVAAAPPPQQVPTDVVFLPVPREQAGSLAAMAATVA